MTVLRVILWWLTVFESVSDSVFEIESVFDICFYPDVKCENGCVGKNLLGGKINCVCGDTNLTYTDVFRDGKHCCLDQTCTGKIKLK